MTRASQKTPDRKQLEKLIHRLSCLSWSFSVRRLERALTEEGYRRVESKKTRRSYQRAKAPVLDVYSDGEDVLAAEMILDAFLDADALSEDEYEDKVDEYFEKFEDVVAAAKGVLGEPKFNEGAAARRFPGDQDAVWLAMWPRAGFRFMVQQKHEDRELPFRVCLVVAPSKVA